MALCVARCTATLLHEMKKRGKAARFGVVSMCIGSGMGAAAVFEQVPSVAVNSMQERSKAEMRNFHCRSLS